MTQMQVQLVDYMGDDDSVANAARVSFSREAKNFMAEQNARLIRYLAEHKHEIPFAHTAITLRMKAPISIRTQCFKHKIGFVENEVSRRYVSDTPTLFMPEFRWKADNVKQGSSEVIHSSNDHWSSEYYIQSNNAIRMYESMIADGIAPEQARFVLPQGVYTEWVWTGSLLAFARFYKLRTDSHAQKEIQDLARMVGDVIAPLFPVAWEALTGK